MLRDPTTYIAAGPGRHSSPMSVVMTQCWGRRTPVRKCLTRVDPADEVGLCDPCLEALRAGRGW